MNMPTIHEAEYHLVLGYRYLTGPPFHLPEESLDCCFFPSMGEGVEGRRPFSFSRASGLIKNWVNETPRELNPFFIIPAALWSTFFGPSTIAVVCTPTLYLLILLLFTYLCGKEINGPSAGLFSALFHGMIPWVIGLSRYGRSYICLIAACAVTYYFLIKTERFSRPIYSMLLVASILFSFYSVPTQTEFILFALAMIGPALVHAASGLTNRRSRFRAVAIVSIGIGVLVLIERNWRLVDYLLDPIFMDAQEELVRGDIFRNPTALLAYPISLVMVQVSPIVALCVAYPIWRFFRSPSAQLNFSPRIDLALMFFVPLAILSYLHKKQPIYIAHLCLPLALAAGSGIACMQRKKCFCLLLGLLATTGLLWRSIPIDRMTGAGRPFSISAARAVDRVLWKDACRIDSPFKEAFFSGNKICYPTQLWIPYPDTIVQPVDPGRWKEHPSSFFTKMSRIDGMRIGLVSGSFGTTVRKGAALMALNPTITVHLFNGMKSFDLSAEDLDWIVVGPTEKRDVERWLESRNGGEVRSSSWDELVPYLYFRDDDPEVRNFRRFMLELREKAELRFAMERHFFFSTPKGWEKAGDLVE